MNPRDPSPGVPPGHTPGHPSEGRDVHVEPVRRGLHPLVATAAVAVILVSAIAGASMLGWLPGVGASAHDREQAREKRELARAEEAAASGVVPPPPEPAKIVAGTPAAAPANKPATGVAAAPPKTAPPKVAPPKVAQAPMQPAFCGNCGVVETTREVRVNTGGSSGADPNNLIGTIGGAAAGGLVGHQFGGGHGKDALTILGALGGALAGREVQERMRTPDTRVQYELRVRMEDGSTRTFHTDTLRFAAGDHVRVVDGQLRAR